jgi:hypothetical protein
MKGRIFGIMCGLGLAGNVEAGELRRDLAYLANFAMQNGVQEGNTFDVEYKGAFVSYTDVDGDGEVSNPDVIWISSDDFTVRDVGLDGFLTGLVEPKSEYFRSGRMDYKTLFDQNHFSGYMFIKGNREEKRMFLERPSPNGEFGQLVQKVDAKYGKKVHNLVTR